MADLPNVQNRREFCLRGVDSRKHIYLLVFSLSPSNLLLAVAIPSACASHNEQYYTAHLKS